MATASPCFTKYLNRKEQTIDVEDLKKMLVETSVGFELHPELAAWRVRYNAMERRQEGEEKILPMLQFLFTHTLSNEYEDREQRGENMLDIHF